MIKLPFNRPSVFTVDADSKKAVVIAVFSNALAPMLITADGMVIDANPDEVNAFCPMRVILTGIVTEVNADAPENA